MGSLRLGSRRHDSAFALDCLAMHGSKFPPCFRVIPGSPHPHEQKIQTLLAR